MIIGITAYDPNAPLNQQPNQVNQGAQAGGGAAQAGGGGAPRATPAELFDRGIKKDKDHYPEFKDEKSWDAFRQSVETTADIHGTSNVLDINYVMPVRMPEAFALFTRQNRFMYSVFESKIKMDMGIALVRSHEMDRDARTVWIALTNYQTTSTAGSLTRESLLAHLMTFKLEPGSWRGTLVTWSFLRVKFSIKPNFRRLPSDISLVMVPTELEFHLPPTSITSMTITTKMK
jgi:hypothetical protein